jgi:hypothetical protein
MTPKYLLRRAIVIMAIYLLLHALGLRDDTSILSSTEPTVSGSLLPMLGAVVYVFFYALAWLLAPILLIAAGLLALWNRLEMKLTKPRPE